MDDDTRLELIMTLLCAAVGILFGGGMLLALMYWSG